MKFKGIKAAYQGNKKKARRRTMEMKRVTKSERGGVFLSPSLKG